MINWKGTLWLGRDKLDQLVRNFTTHQADKLYMPYMVT